MNDPGTVALKAPPGAAWTRHVYVRDLELMAYLGIHEHEKANAQRILVNVDLFLGEASSGTEDDIRNVVDYETVIKKIEAIVAEGHVNLVEKLAERIAGACLADERVFIARIRVEKPDIIPNAQGVGVEIERTR